jgi:hypothetical protein
MDLNINHKHFIALREPNHSIKLHNYTLQDDEFRDVLSAHFYQQFVTNFMATHTEHTRLFLKWDTGIGKSLAAILIAMNYVSVLKQLSTHIGNVWILGFNSAPFKNELMNPRFGFVSVEERNELLKRRAAMGSKQQADIDRYNDQLKRIKKRLTNPKLGGYFRFMGYKEFANWIDTMDDAAVIREFENSFMILDEIHNVYNSLEQNHWGRSIQRIATQIPSLRILMMSATPINNSITEAYDLVQLLNPSFNVPRKALFEGNRLKPGALEILAKAMRGKLSFMRDINPMYFPKRVILGEPIKNVEYLRFERCGMQGLQKHTYAHVRTEDRENLATDEQSIVDFVFPNPDTTTGFGLYRAQDVRRAYASLSDKDKDKLDLTLTDNNTPTGGFLHLPTLRNYSAKYASMMEHTLRLVKAQRGKIFIFHPLVHGTGVMLIAQIMRVHGVIEHGEMPNDSTLCSICAQPRKAHAMRLHKGGDYKSTKHAQNEKTDGKTNEKADDQTDPKGKHEFVPLRMIVIHSEVDKNTIDAMLTSFNQYDNRNGLYINILIGSRMIRESYDIKALQNIFILGRPDNIPTFLQIIGRGIRKNSHIDLPVARRVVYIRIFTTRDTIEEDKWRNKVEVYKEIQKIEKVWHQDAIDSFVNYRTIFANTQTDDKYDLSILPYTSTYKNIKALPTDKDAEYQIYGHTQQIEQIISIILHAFIQISNIWTEPLLWKTVQTPRHGWVTAWNPEDFDKDAFNDALNLIVYKPNQLILPGFKGLYKTRAGHMIITKHDTYLIAYPFNMETMLPIIGFSSTSTNYVSIGVKEFIEARKPIERFPAKLAKFLREYRNAPYENIDRVVCEFHVDFHQLYIEMVVQALYRFFEKHEKLTIDVPIALKVLTYINNIGLIIWKNTAKKPYHDLYNAAGSEPVEVNTVTLDQLERAVKAKHAPAKLWPVGHAIGATVRLYIPRDKLFRSIPQYTDYSTIKWVENPIIIGYDEFSKSGIRLNFKLREPILPNTDISDARNINRGRICASQTHTYLLTIAQQLHIKITPKNISMICRAIRTELMRRETAERARNTKIKWFYSHLDHSRPGHLFGGKGGEDGKTDGNADGDDSDDDESMVETQDAPKLQETQDSLIEAPKLQETLTAPPAT